MQTDDKSSVIFGNPIDEKTLRKAERSKKSFIRKFGDDSEKEYHLGLEPVEQRVFGITLDTQIINNQQSEIGK